MQRLDETVTVRPGRSWGGLREEIGALSVLGPALLVAGRAIERLG